MKHRCYFVLVSAFILNLDIFVEAHGESLISGQQDRSTASCWDCSIVLHKMRQEGCESEECLSTIIDRWCKEDESCTLLQRRKSEIVRHYADKPCQMCKRIGACPGGTIDCVCDEVCDYYTPCLVPLVPYYSIWSQVKRCFVPTCGTCERGCDWEVESLPGVPFQADNVVDWNGVKTCLENGGSCSFCLFCREEIDFESLDGWIVEDHAGNGLVWHLTGPAASNRCQQNQATGNGKAICADSDSFGAADFDTWLKSPEYQKCPEEIDMCLSFVINYQNFAFFDFVDVLISDDGFNSHRVLLSLNSDIGPFAQCCGLPYDLPIPNDIGSPFQIAFRYYDPNQNDFDWWVQVDDVRVGVCPSTSPSQEEGKVDDGGSNTVSHIDCTPKMARDNLCETRS